MAESVFALPVSVEQHAACARKKDMTETLGLEARVAFMKLVIANQWVQVPPS